MKRRTKWIVVGSVGVAILAGGAGVVAAGGLGGNAEPPISGDALEKASEAALIHTGGGRVTDTEVGDEEGYYEVEVTLDNGRRVDVHLDEEFNVFGEEADEESPDDEAEKEGTR